MREEIFRKAGVLKLLVNQDPFMDQNGNYVIKNGAVVGITGLALSPAGWNDCAVTFGWKSFSEASALTLTLGKSGPCDSADPGQLRLKITRSELSCEGTRAPIRLDAEDSVTVTVKDGRLSCGELAVAVPELRGFGALSCSGEDVALCRFEADSALPAMTGEEWNDALIRRRREMLEKAEAENELLAEYARTHPDEVYHPRGSLSVSRGLVDVGETVTVTVRSFGERDVSLLVTKNAFAPDAMPEPIPLDLVSRGDGAEATVELCCDEPGNVRIEAFVTGERLVRQIAVREKGMLTAILWSGSNAPRMDTELHAYDLSGDYWLTGLGGKYSEDPARFFRWAEPFARQQWQYGDQGVPMINATSILPDSETRNLFELDEETQRRGIALLLRRMEIAGMTPCKLAASYTADNTAIRILEQAGIRGMTSLCNWQNWPDGGWKINHWGVANQPYCPAPDDFRRSGEMRDIFCFTMGTTSCARNYSIMTMELCPTLVVPGERYLENRVEHFQAQRFYDAFDAVLAAAEENPYPVEVTIGLESFRGFPDWNAVNSMAMRYVTRRAAGGRIVFASAADVAEYHIRKGDAMYPAAFFQPDVYCGYRNEALPGRIPDRIEVQNGKYLAVVRRDDPMPMYWFDYTTPWEASAYEDAPRNEYNLINPDETDSTDYEPKQFDRGGVKISRTWEGKTLSVTVCSERPLPRMLTGVFDLPVAPGFGWSCDREGGELLPVTDPASGGAAAFLDLSPIEKGENVFVFTFSGKDAVPDDREDRKGNAAAMWFGDHAYLRSLDGAKALSVTLPAPDGAYLQPQDGRKIAARNGLLTFTLNGDWSNEAPILFGFPREAFQSALERAAVTEIGPSGCHRWPWLTE